MVVSFGKFIGRSPEWLVVNHPEYVIWVMSQDPASGMLARLAEELRRLTDRFDERPLVISCGEQGCGRTATCGTLYHRTAVPHWRCGRCDPIANGGPVRKLCYVGSYLDAYRYAVTHCAGRKAALRQLVKEIARAKGLPGRVRATALVSFFRGP